MKELLTFNVSKDLQTADNCPVCQQLGQKVSTTTVKSLVPQVEVPEAVFHICLDPDCRVVYFNQQTLYTVDDLAVKVWFKEATSPKTICYCQDVTDLEIIQHIAMDKCCNSLADLQKHTGANTGKDCLTKNPTGK